MQVLIINGSPHKDGCTSSALKEVEKELNLEGIETVTLNIGSSDIRGCIDCGFCNDNHKCAFDDMVNEASLLFKESDGILIGTPVYYSGMNGTLKAFLDRLFRSSYISKSLKVGACIASSRRAGSTSALDEIYRYFEISNMVISTSTYFNEIHGSEKEDIYLDKEGIQTMKNLGKNMAFLIKSIDLGMNEFGKPSFDLGERTNFIK